LLTDNLEIINNVKIYSIYQSVRQSHNQILTAKPNKQQLSSTENM